MWIYIIPIVFFLYGIAYMIYMHKVTKKDNEEAESHKANFALQIAGIENETRAQYLQENEHVMHIATQVNEPEIIGIISCQEVRNTRDLIRQSIFNILGQIIGKIIKIRYVEVDNSEHYYLTLTSKSLHYLRYNERGVCKEHRHFERNNMSNIEVGKVKYGEMVKNKAYKGATQRLSFKVDNKLYKFFFYDRFMEHPLAKKRSIQDLVEINYLFAKPFLAFAERYKVL